MEKSIRIEQHPATILADNETRRLHHLRRRDDRSPVGRGGVRVEVVAEGRKFAPGPADSRGALARLRAPGNGWIRIQSSLLLSPFPCVTFMCAT